ncbi:hypothetical protein C7M84_000986 [Penaeus vannamei]|uniref:Uncharacterized protein n=1 Tax=Penaeus vannamei TaxID=6689 RepID=A0A423TV32_PENVA|nr:hypothetical protein C7M84_000986 [Penaeus vannamei]
MRSRIRSVTSLSQSPEGEIRVRVASSGAVERAEYVSFVSDVATTAEGHDLANTTSEYTVDVPSRGAGPWDFVVLGLGENGTLVEVGQAYVMSKVGWVSMDAEVVEVWMDDTSASFRLDTGTQKEVVLQDAGACKDTESPCYFLEVPKEPVVREHCIDITNNAEGEGERSSVMQQCGDATGNFSSLPGEVSLTLEGSDKMVVQGDFADNTTVEITIYDSATPSDILSVGATCWSSPWPPGGVEGTLLLDYDYQSAGTAVWVIVVSVLVSLLVVALVGFGIGYIV